MPTDTTLLRWANLSRPATLYQLHDHVYNIARKHKLAQGRKLRIDSTLLGDDISVLTKAISEASTFN